MSQPRELRLEAWRTVTCRLLDLYDAAHEEGLEAWHIEAWLEFEHEALRFGIPTEIEREDLERTRIYERRINCPECGFGWMARGHYRNGIWRPVAGDLTCQDCDSECGVL